MGNDFAALECQRPFECRPFVRLRKSAPGTPASRAWAIATALVCATASVLARPIDPAIDEAPGPFCYFSRPSTVLGVADGREGTQVTPEGWLWTGAAQLVFFAGPNLEPLRQRIRTLLDGYIPVVSYWVERSGVRYTVRMFGATLDGNPASNPVNFVRVTMTPLGKGPATAVFAAAIRSEGDHCCRRMRQPVNVLRARYALTDFCALRDDQLIYMFPQRPTPTRLILPDRPGRGPITAAEAGVGARAPVCMVRYDIPLARGQSASLDFKMPYFPVPMSETETVAALRKASFDDYLQRTVDWWRRYIGKGLQIDLPEQKVVDTFRSSIVYDSIARDKVGDDYIVKVNEFQYDAFWVRDGSYIVNAFDLLGRHVWAEQGLRFFLKSQRSDGIIYQPPQLDGWGQALWAFGQHWRLTGDDRWAREVFPRLARSVRGIFAKTRKDPLGLIPPAPPYDNEAINGHYTGHSLWLMIGMRDMVAMARALGKHDEALEFQALLSRYRANFLRALRPVARKNNGYIPPGLDAENGCDWGNLLLLYPRGGVPARGNFEPDDSMVAATVDTVRRAKYAEGIVTYGRGLRVGLLHHYLTMKVTQNLVSMNRQQDALADFYAILAHTSATNAGFEFSVRPWDNRDPGGNFPPHGWFAAKFIGLLRDMLVREWKGDLHLLTVVSPAWVKPGAVISVRRAPTDFGTITVNARFNPGGMTLGLSARWRQAPQRIILHLPWFVKPSSATADGKGVDIGRPKVGEGYVVVLPPGAGKVDVRWNTAALPNISYERTVEDYKREYRRRFAEFVGKQGKPEPLWPEGPLMMTRQERQEAWAQLQARCGIALGCDATASKTDPGHPASAAVDGVVDRNVHWAATPYPQWWQVDLGKVRRIDRVRVVTYWDHGRTGRSYRYELLVSGDGRQWETVADLSENDERATPSGFLHLFAPRAARYVRVNMLHNSANPGVHLVEVMVYAVPEAPVVEAPNSSVKAWEAGVQTGSKATDMPNWSFVGAERIVVKGKCITARGDRIRLNFRGGRTAGTAIADVSIAQTDPNSPSDILGNTRVPVTFGGASWAELPAGKLIHSDWVRFSLQPGRDYSVTFQVLRTGATTLWPDQHTKRYETTAAGAAAAARWSRLSCTETYNLYFLDSIEVPAG